MFGLFILLCLCACVAGMIETREDPADHEMLAAFRDMAGRRDVPAGANGHASDAGQRSRLNENGKGRGK